MERCGQRSRATDVAESVCMYTVCVSAGHNREAYKTAELIDMPFELWTRVKEPSLTTLYTNEECQRRCNWV